MAAVSGGDTIVETSAFSTYSEKPFHGSNFVHDDEEKAAHHAMKLEREEAALAKKEEAMKPKGKEDEKVAAAAAKREEVEAKKAADLAKKVEREEAALAKKEEAMKPKGKEDEKVAAAAAKREEVEAKKAADLAKKVEREEAALAKKEEAMKPKGKEDEKVAAAAAKREEVEAKKAADLAKKVEREEAALERKNANLNTVKLNAKREKPNSEVVVISTESVDTISNRSKEEREAEAIGDFYVDKKLADIENSEKNSIVLENGMSSIDSPTSVQQDIGKNSQKKKRPRPVQKKKVKSAMKNKGLKQKLGDESNYGPLWFVPQRIAFWRNRQLAKRDSGAPGLTI